MRDSWSNPPISPISPATATVGRAPTPGIGRGWREPRCGWSRRPAVIPLLTPRWRFCAPRAPAWSR